MHEEEPRVSESKKAHGFEVYEQRKR